MASMNTLLKTEGLSKHFGGLQAVGVGLVIGTLAMVVARPVEQSVPTG